MPLKVPPSVLKDSKALEDYVHQHVFPRVDRLTRAYLTQFFTELFSSGWENSGGSDVTDDGAWTGSTGSPAVVEDPHCGTYACQIDAAEGVYKTLGSSYSTIYQRMYVKFTTVGQTDFLRAYGTGGSYVLPTGLVATSATNYYWQMLYRNGGSFGTLTDTAGPVVDTLYCVELYIEISTTGNSDGEQKLYIDGVETLAVSNIDNDDRGNINGIEAGSVNGRYMSGTVVIDCVVVADAYIGLETTLKTVTDSFSLSEAVLRHKTLSLSDSIGLDDLLYGDKTLLLNDAASLSELVTVLISETVKYVTDTVNASDLIKVLKTLKIPDTVTLADTAATPLRILQALDAVGIADNNFVNKTLRVNETISLVEVVEVGVPSVKKTKLFLIIGDLAVQLTGD